MAASEERVDQECVEGYLFSGRPPTLLILRRPPSRGSIWVPVSGKVEASDPSFEAALLRELQEETGFDAPLRVFPLDWEVRFQGPDGGAWRLHAFGVELTGTPTPRWSAEHDAARWVAPEEATRLLHYDDNRAAVQRLIERLPPA